MKTLTKKQRGEIYLEVAKLFETKLNRCGYLCWVLCDMAKTDRDTKAALTKYPEFALFNPTITIGEYDRVWFDTSDQRIICMLLCAEMCKDGK